MRTHSDLLDLTEQRILAWADVHFERNGKYPNRNSGLVHDAPGEKWENQGNRTASSLIFRGPLDPDK
jgi:hypothetical protein